MSDKKSTWLSDMSDGTLIRFKSPGSTARFLTPMGGYRVAIDNSPTERIHKSCTLQLTEQTL